MAELRTHYPNLDRKEYWRLTVHWYPHAVEAGVDPVADPPYSAMMPKFDAKDQSQVECPGGYSTHDFDFEFPPSRDDFIAACLHLPWTQCWRDRLFPIIREKKCDWPMVAPMHKASSSDILDEQGRRIGHLSVYRHHRFINKQYSTYFVPVEVEKKLTRGYKDDAKRDLEHFLMVNENRIREALSEIPGFNYDHILAEGRKLVADWKKQRKQTDKLQPA